MEERNYGPVSATSKAITLSVTLLLSHPVSGAINLCPNGELAAVAQHGAAQAFFYLPLDPALNAAVGTAARVVGNDVFLDVTLGPGAGSPLANPSCFFVTI